MATRWLLKPQPEEEIVQKLMQELNIPRVLATILVQRGVHDFDSAKAYFRPSYTDLHSPFLMADMQKAVERIDAAIKNQERIMVYGDYDVDGTTSVAMMYAFLSSRYSNIIYYIPDRYAEGYGVSTQGIDVAKVEGVTLIISLDCGIKAVDKVAYAQEKGIDFIICDHHLPGEQLPDAVAVLDPKRADCAYPYKELSGCGVGFKLMHALCLTWDISLEILYSYLDLVCVSIAADIVPITGENRILAHFGLQRLNTEPRLGLKMLIPSELKGYLNISKIVFSVAPKINAAGRIKHGAEAVKLLISENEITARSYVSQINTLNSKRKDLDSNITESALQQIEEDEEKGDIRYSNVVYDPTWHKGVIGIVASRLTEVYYRPTVVFTKGDDGKLVASVRSVKGFDVYEALTECADMLERYGGHMYAAGLTMAEVNYPNFKRKFDQVVKNSIAKSQLTPSIDIDSELSFTEITPKFIRILNQFQPFGPKNMTPVFLTKNVHSAGYHKIMGKDKSHLKLQVITADASNIFTAVAFGKAYLIDRIKNEPFDMVYTVEENVWQGKSYLQLQIKDIRFNE